VWAPVGLRPPSAPTAQRKPQPSHCNWSEEWGEVRGLHGFDRDCEVDGLAFALNHTTETKAQFLWNVIAVDNVHQIRGVVESSTQQTFRNSTQRHTESRMGKLLIEKPWLPSASGGFHRPAELSLDDLPDGFRRHEGLAEALEMKASSKRVAAEEIGVPLEALQDIAKLIKLDPDRVPLCIPPGRHQPSRGRAFDL